MSVHPEHGLLVYLDATPDEQLKRGSSLTLALTGLVCDQDSGVENLKQFKDTEFSDRADEARRIHASLESGVLSLYTVSMAAPYESIERFASAQAALLENVLRKKGKRYVIDGKRLSTDTALAMVWYAVAQNLIGLRAAHWAKNMGLKRVTLILDTLPAVPATAMNLVRKVSTESDLAKLWLETITKTGVSFQITNMKEYRPREGEPARPAKEHPHAILVDWITHSLFACFEDNQEYFLGKHPDRTDEEKADYLQAMKSPWFWLHENNRDLLVPLRNLIPNTPDEIAEIVSSNGSNE